MSFKKVVVVGGGVLGSQIAFQTAYCGFDVTIWLRSEGSIKRAQPKIDTLKATYLGALAKMHTPEGKNPLFYCQGLWSDPATFDEHYEELVQDVEKAYANLKLETSMEKAFADADFVIESMAENPQQKIEFYQAAASFLPEKTVLATNSSTMIPSMFAQYTGRPEKYLALHFANSIWRGNTAEVMGHAGTEQTYYDQVAEFAKEIRMIPLRLHKEQPGYILNTLLVPLLDAGMYLWSEGISSVEDIDLTWRRGAGASVGPMQILDIIGVTTAYNVVSMKPASKDPNTVEGRIAAKLKEMIDANKLGVATGEGFYKYKK